MFKLSLRDCGSWPGRDSRRAYYYHAAVQRTGQRLLSCAHPSPDDELEVLLTDAADTVSELKAPVLTVPHERQFREYCRGGQRR